MRKKEFAVAVLDLEHETFVVHVTSLSSNPLDADVHPSCRPQIAGLIVKKAPIKVLVEYADFADVFSPDLASELPKHTWMNDYPTGLVDNLSSHLPTLQYFSSTRMVTFDYASEADHQEPVRF